MITNRRILTIQDISCVGQCSTTVAQPILSACGIETCILPSAVLSTHTGGFGAPHIRDLSDDIPGIIAHWNKEDIRFDAVYTGYLGSVSEIRDILELMDTLLLPGGIKLVDPAMADHGKLYSGFDETYVGEMKKLCGAADIILPNITEACFLTGTEYREDGHDEAYVNGLLEKLASLGAGTVVLKGILDREGQIGNAVYRSGRQTTDFIYRDKVGHPFHGTGDCFASVLLGGILQGLTAAKAAALAADFIAESILQTESDADHWYGVKFERALPMLVTRLNRTVFKSEQARAAGRKRRYVLDGADFGDRNGFYREIGKLLSVASLPESGNLDGLNDLLRGGFGKHAYGEQFEIVWKNFEKSTADLGPEFMTRLLTMMLNREDDHDVILKIER